MSASSDKDALKSAKIILSRWMVRLSSLMLKTAARLDKKTAVKEQHRLLATITNWAVNNMQETKQNISEKAETQSKESTQSFLMTLDACEKLIKLTKNAADHSGPLDDFLFHFIVEYRTFAMALQRYAGLCENAFLRREVGDQIFNLFIQFSMIMPHELGIRAARQTMMEHVDPHQQFLVPTFIKSEKPVTNTWTYQNEVLQWDFRPDDLVLDIGSGGWPFSKATHLADMFTGETTHRDEELQKDERPFLCLDIHNMPFADNTWDFTFCSHVLEHLDTPGDAMRELARVSRRGYIEVPTRLSDVMLNFTRLNDHHRWHGMVLDGTLVLTEWRDDERRNMGSDNFFLALQSGYENEFRSYFERNWDIFYAILRWEGEIPFIIIDKHGRVIDRHEGRGAS